MSDMIWLESRESKAAIALLGAELQHWAVRETQLIWTPSPAIWGEAAPLLFPVVGWTRNGSIEVAGQAYPLGVHGFARHQPFKRVTRGPDHVSLVLEASEATFPLYPYDFALHVTYRLDGPSLRAELGVANRGAVTMPYACGLHPGFRWPFSGGALDDYRIVFGEPEIPSVPVISAEGLFTSGMRAVPFEGRELPLAARLFEGEALCFLGAKSSNLKFAHRDGTAITLALEGFPHLALWSKPEGRFLSIEAWTGYGDGVDAPRDFLVKPSMIHLEPGQSRTHTAVFGFEP